MTERGLWHRILRFLRLGGRFTVGLFYYIYNMNGFYTIINKSERGPGNMVAAGKTPTCPDLYFMS